MSKRSYRNVPRNQVIVHPDRRQLDWIKSDRRLLIEILRQAGAVVRGKSVQCPFHDDHKASASIYCNRRRQWRVKCFACGWRGDVIDVMQWAMPCDFLTACERLGLLRGSRVE